PAGRTRFRTRAGGGNLRLFRVLSITSIIVLYAKRNMGGTHGIHADGGGYGSRGSSGCRGRGAAGGSAPEHLRDDPPPRRGDAAGACPFLFPARRGTRPAGGMGLRHALCPDHAGGESF